MEKQRVKKVFICQSCGRESPKWEGRCSGCQEWNCLVETTVARGKSTTESRPDAAGQLLELARLQHDSYSRITFPIGELNRVLGGGLVAGSVVLISGDPGIGKSTLLLQISDAITKNNNSLVVYVSGEESSQQLKMRAERLGVKGGGLFVYPETNMENVMAELESMQPSLVVVDSVQTVYIEDINGAPGSINQIRECTLRLLRWAKRTGVPVFISGHVTKDGSIAGPKALEHIVDVVLSLEGESFNSYRILRSTKNRFGSTNEVGVFEMGSLGLIEVANPSQFFLESYVNGAIGAAVVPTLEGSRPLLVEVQALTSVASYGPPRRISNGVDFNRLLLICAVLTRRAGVGLYNQDVIVNVTGGIRISEPAADLGIAMAIASSFKDARSIPGTVAVGEIGLSGELRSVPQMDRRVSEAARLGFTRCIIPASVKKALQGSDGLEIIRAGSIAEALRAGLEKTTKKRNRIMSDRAGVAAIVVGAGSGSRIGADKAFLELAGKPVIAWPVEILQRNINVREIVLVLHKSRLEQGRGLAEKMGWSKVSRVCAGGNLRQDSVKNGLAGVSDCELVLIHDAARPFLTDRLIDDGIKAAGPTGAAAAAVPVKDTVKQVDENQVVSATLPRDRLMAVQTPQVFQYKILKEAYGCLDSEVTDDAAAVERIGRKVKLYTGDYANIKITTREDLALAEIIAKRR